MFPSASMSPSARMTATLRRRETETKRQDAYATQKNAGSGIDILGSVFYLLSTI